MKQDLQGKTAVITGSTAGVGYKIAEKFAYNGVNIVINGRRPEAVRNSVERLRGAFPLIRIQGVATDVGTPDGVIELTSTCPHADILINNVSIYDPKDFFDISDMEWERYFEVNVMSAVRLVRSYLPGMLSRYWGRILMISSEWALNIPADMIPYGMTKAAVLSLTQGIAKRISNSGVTVNSILPGPVQSELNSVSNGVTQDVCLTMEETIAASEARRMHSGLAFLRIASAEEISEIAVDLCSSRGAGRNGTLVHVDGHLGKL